MKQNYQELKAQKEAKFSKLLEDCKVFWAFSNEQFAENKTELKEGDKYVSIGDSGYMPKSYVQLFLNGNKEITKWYKSEMKKSKDNADAEILYELNNHECFYVGHIDDVVGRIGYSRERIQKVYNANVKKYWETHD